MAAIKVKVMFITICTQNYAPLNSPLLWCPLPLTFFGKPALVLGTLDYVFSSRLKNAKFCGKLKHC